MAASALTTTLVSLELWLGSLPGSGSLLLLVSLASALTAKLIWIWWWSSKTAVIHEMTALAIFFPQLFVLPISKNINNIYIYIYTYIHIYI